MSNDLRHWFYFVMLVTSISTSAAEYDQPKKQPTLLATTQWISEFAPSRLFFSSLDSSPFASRQPGFYEVNSVESFEISNCDVKIRKFEDRILVQFDPEKYGLTDFSSKKWITYEFNLKGTVTRLDTNEDGEVKRGYDIFRVRFNPECEKNGECPRFVVKQFEGEGIAQKLMGTEVLDGGIRFESSRKNGPDVGRIVSAMNHASTLCSNKSKPNPF